MSTRARLVIAVLVLAGVVQVLPASGLVRDFPNVEISSVTTAGHRQNLSTNPALDTAPAIAPNGRTVAFVSSRNGMPDLYLMNIAGANVRRLTTSPFTPPGGSDPRMIAWGEFDAGTTTVAWSPDSRRIAFVALNAKVSPDCFQECYTASVYVMNADGAGLRLIDDGRMPVWSPNGKSLAYEGDVSPFGESNAVYITRLDGSRKVRVSSFNGDDTMPAWSPGGTRIAFQTLRHERLPAEIDIVDATGLHRKKLVIGSEPVWSRTGSVAFIRGGRLHVVGGNGKGDRVLSRVGESAGTPAWSLEGTRIAVTVRAKQAHSCQLAVVNATTGVERQVTRLPLRSTFDAGPVWAPNGDKLLFATWRPPSGGCG